MISVSTVSDTIDHSVVDPRFHPIHWRFQELLIEHHGLRGGDPQDIGEWALRVCQTVRELLDPDHECVADTKSLLHELRALDFVRPGLRRKQEIHHRLRGPIRAQGYGLAIAAAMAERPDRTVLRVVDLHPWVAELAEPLWNDEYWFAAVTAAGDNVRAKWKAVLGLRTARTEQLVSASSLDDPKPGQPRMRFACYDRDRDEDEWNNGHEGSCTSLEGA